MPERINFTFITALGKWGGAENSYPLPADNTSAQDFHPLFEVSF